MEIKDFIKSRRIELGITQAEVGKACSVSEATVSRWESGDIENMKRSRIADLAKVLKINPTLLMGDSVEVEDKNGFNGYPGLIPIESKKVPLLGTMACGEPVYREEDFESYVAVGNDVRADAAVRAEGDSMIGARIMDGDIVFIRYQPTVENGEIAAVWVDEGFTLKRVYQYGNMLVLRPENPEYDETVYTEDDCKTIKILGKAVAFQSDVK